MKSADKCPPQTRPGSSVEFGCARPTSFASASRPAIDGDCLAAKTGT